MDSTESKQLSDQIQKKIQLVENLLDYARQQSQMSYIDAPEKYNNLLETRAIIIEQIKKQDIVLQRKLRAIKEIDGDMQARLNEADCRITDLMKQIAFLDQKSKAAVVSKMQVVQSKLQALQKGKKGIKSYKDRDIFNPSGAFSDSKY